MQIYWWNGGLHVEPETDAERDAREVIANNVNRHAPEDMLPRRG